ncbi:MAG: primosomal protein N' [Bryobacterales bacterium]|nr:primosomal protein N' [Bryobacterales bacterium]
MEPAALYCDVSLPVPLDQTFTYILPAGLHHRVRRGARVIVPFGNRKLTGIVLAIHPEPPGVPAKEVLRLLDEEPVLDDELLSLGKWIGSYYCAPLGEVLRTMTPLGGETRKTKTYQLTPSGRDAARQLLLGTPSEEPAVRILRLLEPRPLSAGYLLKRVPKSENALKGLIRRGFVMVEEDVAERDPLRAPAARLQVEFAKRSEEKLPKAERELLAFLELYPGTHNLGELEPQVRGASQAARALARRGYAAVKLITPTSPGFHGRDPHPLNIYQQKAFDTVTAALQTGQFTPYLLQGVTGSGKTEVYLRLIDETLKLGRGALMLVPEIGLTPAVAGQFFHRFGDRVAILHSAFSNLERAEQWRRIRNGDAGVVVGTRSGVFAPVRNLGLIVIDEEHDSSYKQEETPRYNGRDVAVVRARAANGVVVLGSATPSLETRFNAEKGKYTLLELPERIERRPMPEVDIIDMRQEFLETRKHTTFSRRLVDNVRHRLARGEQAMLLMNRRGYSSFVSCRACGERIQCQNCAVTLTYHRRDRRLLCHYCGYAEKVPEVCPKCESEHIYFLGTGSEKVEAELSEAFPEARVARLDRDTVSSRRDYEEVLHGFREKRYDLLVGTQMIAKGHDIPNVTLVGIVNADIGLGMPDFRAAERTFQLLTQAAGRAGRGEVPGQVMLQTINPDHYAVRFAAAQDYLQFYKKELEFRRLMRYPPYAALANLLVRHVSQEEALRLSAALGDFLKPPPEGVKVIGPAEAPVPKLKQEFRYQLLLKSMSRKTLNDTLQSIRNMAITQRWPATALVIDVDPLTLL